MVFAPHTGRVPGVWNFNVKEVLLSFIFCNINPYPVIHNRVQFCPSGNFGKCLETFLDVTNGGRCYWHLYCRAAEARVLVDTL